LIGVAAAVGLATGCAHRPLRGEFTVTAVVESIPKTPGCGVIFFATPIKVRVVEGPSGVRGKHVFAYVACLDFYPDYYVVGRSYQLSLTTDNVHHADLPDHLTEPLSFYVKDATRLDPGRQMIWR